MSAMPPNGLASSAGAPSSVEDLPVVPTQVMDINPKESNDIENVAGFVSGNYDCVYNGVHGTLYAGSVALYFVGTFFLFEKKVIIPWERIRQVQRLDQGVAVVGKDEKVHSFTSLHAPARAWVILVSLHNDALLDPPSSQRGRKRAQFMSPDRHHGGSRSVKRRNSDPAATSGFMDALEYHSDDVPNQDVFRRPSVTKQKNPRTAQNNHAKEATPKRPVIDFFKELAEPNTEDIAEKVGRLKLHPMNCSHAGYSGKLCAGNRGLYFYGRRLPWEMKKVFIRFASIRQFQIQGKEEESPQKHSRRQRGLSIVSKDGQVYSFESMENADKVWATLIALQNENLAALGEDMSRRQFSLRRMNSDPMMPSRISFDESSEEPAEPEDSDQHSTTLSEVPSLADEWSAEIAKQKDYASKVVKGQMLPCTIDKFIELFVADGATYSVAKFLEGRGDLDLEVSDWEKSGRGKETRVIHYKHPVNAPLAPPLAGARKEQCFRRYGDYGLCLETKTIVDDVPMADCFYVADRVRVSPKGKSSVTVTMEFDITFIKSTMFKSIIGKTTKSEFTNLFESLFRYFKENLGEPVVVPETTSKAKQLAMAAQPTATPMYQSALVPALLCTLFVFQLYILFEVRKISVVVQSIQKECQISDGNIFTVVNNNSV